MLIKTLKFYCKCINNNHEKSIIKIWQKLIEVFSSTKWINNESEFYTPYRTCTYLLSNTFYHFQNNNINYRFIEIINEFITHERVKQ